MASVPPRIRPPARGGGRVKPPKKHGQPDNKMMDRLADAIEKIQQRKVSELSYEEHYRYGYTLVLHRQGHVLYNGVADLVARHLERETLQKICSRFPDASVSVSTAAGASKDAGRAGANLASLQQGEIFLKALDALWRDHQACMSRIRDILKYMDRNYTGMASVPKVWELGLSLFLHHVLLFSTDPEPVTKPGQAAASTSKLAEAAASMSPTEASVLRFNKRRERPPLQDPTCVGHHVVKTLLDLIRVEREGEVISRSLVSSVIEMLNELTDEAPVPLPIIDSVGLGSGAPKPSAIRKGGTALGEATTGTAESVYRTSFEKQLLAQTQAFYEDESAAALIDLDAPGYLRKVDRRLQEEADRSQTYLIYQQTEPQLSALLNRTLITAHMADVISHPALGFSILLQESRFDDLTRMYGLFGRVADGHRSLQVALAKWIVDQGLRINDGLALAGQDMPEQMDHDGEGKKESEQGAGARTRGALQWVQNVLDLKDKFDELRARAFHNDKAFEKTINDAFTTFVNKNAKAPEYVSLFLDENLKKGLKGKSEAEVDVVLDKAIALFRFLIEKDRFERYYNTHLSRRLITNRSVSEDAERGMLSKLKIESGSAFTKSGEGMMKDIKTSEDMAGEFRRYQDRANAKRSPFDMSVIVCSQNYWLFGGKDASCVLPQALQLGAESFEAFYNTKHTGRVLTFRPDLGSVDVRARFSARSHELNVSTYAMCVLSLFDKLRDGESLRYTDVAIATGIPSGDLRRTLQSLACAKYKILLKSPKGREVNDGDKFIFNAGFTCSLARIKIQQVANKVESVEEAKETEEKVDEARALLTDACIVRVMKDRKAMLHNELLQEVTRQLSPRFQPQPIKIKQAIERLIEKEFLERDAVDRKRLLYLA